MNDDDSSPRVREVERGDFDAWSHLYACYARAIGEDDATPDVASTVWRWIHEPDHPAHAALVFSDGVARGFAHYRAFPRTLNGNDACFLDDVFVDEAARGRGLARALIGYVVAAARERGWTHVRWVTDIQNVRAQRLYERIAVRMPLLTYRIDC